MKNELFYANRTQTLYFNSNPVAKLGEILKENEDAALIIKCFLEEGFESSWIYDPMPPRHVHSQTLMHKSRVERALYVLNSEFLGDTITFSYDRENDKVRMELKNVQGV